MNKKIEEDRAAQQRIERALMKKKRAAIAYREAGVIRPLFVHCVVCNGIHSTTTYWGCEQEVDPNVCSVFKYDANAMGIQVEPIVFLPGKEEAFQGYLERNGMGQVSVSFSPYLKAKNLLPEQAILPEGGECRWAAHLSWLGLDEEVL
jgi:hypothetical protein